MLSSPPQWMSSFVAEQRAGHRAALDVPAGTPAPPRTLPTHVAVGLVPRFPERKISEAFLFVLVAADPAARAQLVEIEVGQLAVIGKFLDAVIDAAVFRLVGIPTLDQHADHLDHPRDVLGCRRLGKRFRRLDSQRVEIFKKGLLERRGEFRQRNPRLPAAANRLVVHVGQIHHAMHVETARFQVTLQQVFKDVGAKISDVREAVNGRSAGVEFYRAPARVERRELFELARVRVERRGGMNRMLFRGRQPEAAVRFRDRARLRPSTRSRRPSPRFPRRDPEIRDPRSWLP